MIYMYYIESIYMINNNIFFEHHRLAVNGIVRGILCPDDDLLHPFFDFETEKVYFECLICDFKVRPGLDIYNKMSVEIRNYFLNIEKNGEYVHE